MPERTYTLTDAGIVSDDGRTSIPPDPDNADYQRALVDLARDHRSVVSEIAAARAARKANEDDARSKKRTAERNARQAVKAWLAATPGAPTLKQLADALGSAADDA